MSSVSILVPRHAMGTIEAELGGSRSVTLATEPAAARREWLVVCGLRDLASARVVGELANLLRAAATLTTSASLVLLATQSRSRATTPELLQTLISLSRQTLREPFVADPEAFRRLLAAHRSGSQEQLIASATLEDGKLVVWSCEPARYALDVADIPALAKLSRAELARFAVSTSGSRIRWSDADVDVNLDTIREYADPEIRRRHEHEARKDMVRYADAIRRFREERGLKQRDIEGIAERHIRRVEAGETFPRHDTIKKLAAAHGLPVNDYLGELARRSESTPASHSRARRSRRARASK